MEKELQQILFDFIKRVAEGKKTSETEVQILPEVARVLLESLY